MEGFFKITSLIGKGTFGKVYKGFDPSGTCIAIKKICTKNLNPKALSLLEQEIEVMRSINHPNTVELKWCIKTSDCVYMIMEYCEGGDLDSYFKSNSRIPLLLLRKWIKMLLETLFFLHSQKIMHRDLKLANFLLTSKNPDFACVKIADFGFAKVMEQSITTTQLGSPLYMAPEIFRCDNYGIKADIWSLGTVFYEMMTRKPLYNCYNIGDLVRKQTENIKFPSGCKLPQEALELLLKMLSYDEKTRPDCEELLNSRFFSESFEEKHWQMETLQENYLFVSSDNEEEYKNDDFQSSELQNSEIFDDSEETPFEFINTEINLFLIEKIKELSENYQSQGLLNVCNCLNYYLAYSVSLLNTKLDLLYSEHNRNQIFANVLDGFRSRIESFLGSLNVRNIEEVRSCLKDLEKVIENTTKFNVYVLKIVKEYLMLEI